MGNFASAAETLDAGEDDIERTISQIMFREEAGQEVISVLTRATTSCANGGEISFRRLSGEGRHLVYACIEALNFISHTTRVATALVPFGICSVTASILRGAGEDGDVDMLDPAVGLTATLAYAEPCAEGLCASPDGDETMGLLLGFMLQCVRFCVQKKNRGKKESVFSTLVRLILLAFQPFFPFFLPHTGTARRSQRCSTTRSLRSI
jgi:hypothetical protein